jgi:hypothetical protein
LKQWNPAQNLGRRCKVDQVNIEIIKILDILAQPSQEHIHSTHTTHSHTNKSDYAVSTETVITLIHLARPRMAKKYYYDIDTAIILPLRTSEQQEEKRK